MKLWWNKCKKSKYCLEIKHTSPEYKDLQSTGGAVGTRHNKLSVSVWQSTGTLGINRNKTEHSGTLNWKTDKLLLSQWTLFPTPNHLSFYIRRYIDIFIPEPIQMVVAYQHVLKNHFIIICIFKDRLWSTNLNTIGGLDFHPVSIYLSLPINTVKLIVCKDWSQVGVSF